MRIMISKWITSQNIHDPLTLKMERNWPGWLAALTLILGAGCKMAGPPSPMNVLFIAIDDLRPQLGCYDLPYMKTPNLDALAGQGFVFDRHYVQIPTCGASRYSLLTGHRPVSPRYLSNDVFAEAMSGQPEQEAPESFVHDLRRHGYVTGAVGKISHAPDGRVYGYSDVPTEVREMPYSWDYLPAVYGKWCTGWNAFFGYADGSNRQSRDKQVPPMEVQPGPDTLYPDGWITEAAIALLDSLDVSGKPFFLGVGYFKPHLPWTVPQKYWNLYEDADIPVTPVPDIPDGVSPVSLQQSGEFNQYLETSEHPDLEHPASPAYARQLRHAYAACVSYIDAQVGALMAALERRGLMDRTLIVVWGDHGWHLGDERVWGKHTLSEYALRSTLLMKVPGLEHQARHIGQPVESLDIFPTIMEVNGLTGPENQEGKSLWPLLKGAGDDPEALALSYWRQGISVRDQRFRLTQFVDRDSLYVQFFDYRDDPVESANVAAGRPQQVREMQAKLAPFIPEYLQTIFRKSINYSEFPALQN